MRAVKCLAIFTVLLFCFSSVFSNVAYNRTERRVRIPFLGIGPICNGCPPHYCDDDPAIIHGFCCGCATFYDSFTVPIVCLPHLNCPLNIGGLCDDYEYMMHCCCK